MSDHIKRLKDDHKDFDLGNLDFDFESNPILAFQKWFDEACEQKEPEPNAFCLSTVDMNEQQPTSRIVYLKDLRNDEFVFYTNYSSDKAGHIEVNPKVSMLFFWAGLQRQIRICGTLSKITAKESDDYFNSRPRSSQIGAWASQQSEILNNSLELAERVKEFEAKFPTKIPRPEFWGGYALSPTYFEFWQGRPSRLHDRVCADLRDGKWIMFRKNP